MATTPSGLRAFWLLLCCTTAGACGQSESEGPPNVILIVMDTLRADYLSFYGDQGETMPFVASLAAEGMVFENAISSSSWTAPSTASLMTGVYADRHGVHQGFLANLGQLAEGSNTLQLNRISSRTPTLGELFQARGYATFGLASNINIGPEIGFGRGFERFERHDEWAAQQLYARMMEWRDEMHGERPFFLYLHLNDVHKPYQKREAWFRATPEVPEVGLYRSEMGYLDHWIARMLADLEPGANTLVVLTSDHGEELNERGAVGHHMSLHTEVNSIVMLFHGPALGIQAGRMAREVSAVDLAPSIMELIGSSMAVDRAGDALDGSSMAPFMLAASEPALLAQRAKALDGRALFAHREGSRGGNLFCVVKGRWKLIRKRGKDSLYDLVNDPGELHDVRADNRERYRELLRELELYEARAYEVEAVLTEIEFNDALIDKLGDLGYTESSE